MAKPKARARKVVPVDESSMAELQSFLPSPPEGSRVQAVVPYLKSFRSQDFDIEIDGSVLKYTACSSKKWVAPGPRAPKRVFA